VLANGAIGVLDPLIPLWLNDEFGLNILYQSLVFGVCSLTYLLGTPLAGIFKPHHLLFCATMKRFHDFLAVILY
jgi:hypothetical protein